MNLNDRAALLLFATLLIPFSIFGAEKTEGSEMRISIDPSVIHRFTVSLLELHENTQHKHLSAEEIEKVAKIFRSAKYEKEMEYLDCVRTSYISRYQFTHGYLGGTPKSGKSESGMLTINAETLYWKKGIFTLDTSEAAKLLKIFPSPVNPRTVSERPEAEVDERNAEDADDQAAAAEDSNAE